MTTQDIDLGVLARGDKGDKGDKGDVGPTGPAPTLTVGSVTKLNPSQLPTVSLSGSNGKYSMDFGIPQGATGDTNATATQALNIANSVNSKVTAIQANGGGRNLLQGTGTASGDVGNGNGTFVKGAFNGYNAFKTNGAWIERYINLQSALSRTNAKAGDWYTISVYVKADKQIDTGSLMVCRALGNVGANTNDGFLDGIQMQDKPITTQWQQYAWSFQINNVSLQRQNTRVEYSQDTGDNWIYWAGWMLEKGTIAHEWQPAPEDIQSEIDANSALIKSNTTEIGNAKTAAANAQSTADSALSKANSNATTLNNKVNKSDLTWSNVSGKPNVATKSDLTWANISGKPSIPSTFNGTITDTSTDFNNLISEGHYDVQISPSYQGKNGPNQSDRGLLDVKVAGRMIVQTYYSDTKNEVYVRNRRDGTTWTAWRQGTFWS